MRLIGLLAFLGFIISIIIHFLSLFAALIGLKLLWQLEILVYIPFAGTVLLSCLMGIAGLFIAPGASKNQLWDTAFDGMPKWTKRTVNGFMSYICLSAVILFVLLLLSGTAGKHLKEDNGKYFLQQKNGMRQELTVSDYTISRNYAAALIFDIPAVIYLIQSVYAYSYYILSKQRSR